MNVLTFLMQVTISSAVLYLVILLFRKLFAGRISAMLQYGLWFLLVFRLMIPFTIDTGFRVFVMPQPADLPVQTGTVTLEQVVGFPPAIEVGAELPSQPDAAPVEGAAMFSETRSQHRQPAGAGHSQPWGAGDVAIAVWAAGMAIAVLWYLSVHARLSRSIARGHRPLSLEDRRVFYRVAGEMGLNGGIGPLRVDNVTAPALTVGLFPKLLLPADNLEMPALGEEDLENVFRHELTHYKRKDHLVSLLLVVLRCVYWFNPVVWLAARQMELDMEIACDNFAARDMDTDGKKRYASTILALFSRSGKPQFVMGMGLANVRASAERRLRGVFMSAKSESVTKIVAVIVAVILFVACFTTACNPMSVDAMVSTGSETTAPTATPASAVASSATPTDSETSAAVVTQEPTPIPTPTPEPEPTVNPNLSALRKRSTALARNITAGIFTFALRKDGKIVQAGSEKTAGTFNTSKWRKIIAISSGYVHLAGLKSDGTVVVAGSQRSYLNRYVKGWKKIIAISAGGNNTVMGLKADGTVAATGIGYNSADPNKIKNWKNIIAVAAGERFGIGLKPDGTVVAAGNNEYGQCDVGDWTDIVAIAASTRTSVGLKADGTVVAAGYDNDGQCNVESWRDIVAVAASGFCTVGLKADGTVVLAGWNPAGEFNAGNWSDIIAIAAGNAIIGLKSDGTMVAFGANDFGECEVEKFKDIATVSLK